MMIGARGHDKKALLSSIQRFKEYLSLAKVLKCNIVGTETGSYNMDMTFHPYNHSDKAMQTVTEIIKDLVSEAEKHEVVVGIEGVYDLVVSTPEKMRKLINDVSSDYLQVIFDPVNLVNNFNYKEIKSIIERAYKLFGHKICLIHAKDFVFQDGKIVAVPLGEGFMDYDHLLRLIHEYNPSVEIIIEELSGDELKASHLFLREKMEDLRKNVTKYSKD